MSSLYRVEGGLRAIWQHRAALLWWDAPFGLAAGVWTWFSLEDAALLPGLNNLLPAQVSTMGALLGLVFAGLAILIALFDEEWVHAIAMTRAGVSGWFFPFYFTGLAITAALLMGGASILLVPQATRLQLRLLLTLNVALSIYAVAAVVGLLAYVMHAGGNRAMQLAKRREDS